MKKLFLILLSVLIVNMAHAQAEPDGEKGGGFCMFSVSFRTIDHSFSMMMSGVGGYTINNYRFGAYFSGMNKPVDITGIDSNPYDISEIQGGAYFGYPFFSEHAFHMLLDLRAGYGQSKLVDTNHNAFDKAGFIALSPSIAVEYSVSDIFKVALGIDYQFHIGVQTPQFYKQSILNTPEVYISLQVGVF